MTDADLCYTPATELAAMIRAKTLSPVELMRVVLARIETLNPTLNAFCTLVADTALTDARAAEAAVMRGAAGGPLHGVPFSIKDLALTKGIRSMSGSHIFATRVPGVDAPFVTRLRAAGGVMLGKTTTPGSFTLRKDTNHVVVLEKEGYSSETVTLTSGVGPAVAGNIILGG